MLGQVSVEARAWLLASEEGGITLSCDAPHRASLDRTGYLGRMKKLYAGISLLSTLWHGGVFAQQQPLDSTFSGDGLWNYPGIEGYVFDDSQKVLPYPDGRVLLALTVVPNNGSDERVFLTRLMPDGTPDPSFGDGGATILTGLGIQYKMYDAMLTPEGGVIGCGTNSTSFPIDTSLVFRVDATGAFDPTFGVGGIARVPGLEYALTMAQLSDGKYILGGSSETDGVLMKMDADGTLDASFGDDGVVAPQLSRIFRDIVVDGDDNIYTVGVNLAWDLCLFGFTATGDPLLSFGVDGFANQPVSQAEDAAVSLELMPDGKLLACAQAQYNNTVGTYLLRCNADGTRDYTFGVDGVVTSDVIPGGGYNFMQTVTTEDAIWVCGHTMSLPVACASKFDLNGTLITTFGDQGLYTIPFDTTGFLDLAPGIDDRIFGAGFILIGSTSKPLIACFDEKAGEVGIAPVPLAGVRLAVRNGQAGELVISAAFPLRECTIRNAAGQVVRRITGLSSNTCTTNAAAWAPGVYLISANGSKEVATGSFTVTR
jgi:uncharacterized delta-60 repeat protein